MDACSAVQTAVSKVDSMVAWTDETTADTMDACSAALMAENLAVWKVALMDVPWVG